MSETADAARIAERAAERALSQMRDSQDASANLGLAVAAWDVVMSEASEATRADIAEIAAAEVQQERRVCTCPAGLVERGGFRSSCPTHGLESCQ